MRLSFGDATQRDADVLTRLHAETAAALTERFGEGPWSRPGEVKRVEPPSAFHRLRVGRHRGQVVTALRLQTKKPWAIDVAYFTPVPKAIYLTGMVTALRYHGKGLGRSALDDAQRITREWPADAIRLDAWDADAGAGPFYRKCGFTEKGHVVYKGSPLVYYELLLDR
jgi:GNAT superfamily N-acetyltransferase